MLRGSFPTIFSCVRKTSLKRRTQRNIFQPLFSPRANASFVTQNVGLETGAWLKRIIYFDELDLMCGRTQPSVDPEIGREMAPFTS